MLAQYLTPTVESIDHQYDGLLMNDLTVLFGVMVDAPDVNLGAASQKVKPKIEKVIFDRTGLNIKLNVSDDPFPNAWVMPPQIDRNHPLLTDFHRAVYKMDGVKKLKDKKTVLNGTVDRKRAKVSGIFSEIPVSVNITKDLVSGQMFTADEIAAIVIHELGHVFTYYEYLGSSVTTNYVLNYVTRELLGTNDRKRRYQIVKEGCKALEIDLDDPEALTATNNEVVIQTVILRKYAEKRMSELGSPTHDLTAWEMMSDQFVSRHGGGRSLVTGLDKLLRWAGDTSYSNNWEYHAMEFLKILLVIGVTTIFAPFVILVLMAFVDTNEDLYDKPKARMERVRRDMVTALKDPKLNKATTRKITEDLEVIDTVLEEMKDRRTYLQFFWSTFRTKGRRNYQQLQFQQELEVLANNDIFARAAKLRTITL